VADRGDWQQPERVRRIGVPMHPAVQASVANQLELGYFLA
jgi:hypothetical protein